MGVVILVYLLLSNFLAFSSAALCTSEIASSVDPGKTGDPDYWNLVMKGNAAAEDLTLMLGRGLTEDLAGVIKKRAELNCHSNELCTSSFNGPMCLNPLTFDYHDVNGAYGNFLTGDYVLDDGRTGNVFTGSLPAPALPTLEPTVVVSGTGATTTTARGMTEETQSAAVTYASDDASNTLIETPRVSTAPSPTVIAQTTTYSLTESTDTLTSFYTETTKTSTTSSTTRSIPSPTTSELATFNPTGSAGAVRAGVGLGIWMMAAVLVGNVPVI